jgi:2-methylcitrate dehydratase PrpD
LEPHALINERKKEVKEEKMEVAREVARFIVRTDLSQIPAQVIEKGKRCILDALGCGVYGQEFEATKIVSQLAREWGGRPEASIIGAGTKVPSGIAALSNGIAIHVADYDDSSVLFRGHPTSVVLPPVLALSETKLKSGRDLLLAYILGIEVGGKLGKVMGWPHYEAGWHGTGTIGTIASAAASSKVLGLDEEKTSHALAIAASEASGIRENFGTMVKSFHAGQASAAGVLASLLAEKGYKGSLTAFEGQSGFRRVFSGESEMSRWASELGEPYVLMDVGFKRYPCCATIHPALDALEDFRKAHPFSWEDVEEVKCLFPPVILSILVYPEPHTGLEAKFSLQYCISSFLVYGKLDLSHFEKEALSDPKVRKLMPRVKMAPSKDLENLMKAENLLAPTDIEVKLKKQTLSRRILEAKGGPSSPLQIEEVREKFRTCAGRVLSSEKVEKAIDLVSFLESLQQVSPLAETLNP